jgi:hypothetical protein
MVVSFSSNWNLRRYQGNMELPNPRSRVETLSCSRVKAHLHWDCSSTVVPLKTCRLQLDISLAGRAKMIVKIIAVRFCVNVGSEAR